MGLGFRALGLGFRVDSRRGLVVQGLAKSDKDFTGCHRRFETAVLYIYIYRDTHIHIFNYKHKYICICLYIHTYLYLFIHMYTYVCMCMYIYIYIFIYLYGEHPSKPDSNR